MESWYNAEQLNSGLEQARQEGIHDVTDLDGFDSWCGDHMESQLLVGDSFGKENVSRFSQEFPKAEFGNLERMKKKKKSTRRKSMGGSSSKYESVLEKIDSLDEENRNLKRQVSKLKLSLALTESHSITQREAALKLSPTTPKHDMLLLDSSPRHTGMDQIDTTQHHLVKSEREKEEEEGEEMIEQFCPEEYEDADWAAVYRQLVTSESFRLVGTGKSILDSLSASSRRDVVMRYCDILDTIRRSKLT